MKSSLEINLTLKTNLSQSNDLPYMQWESWKERGVKMMQKKYLKKQQLKVSIVNEKINSQIQETQKTLCKINIKKISQGHHNQIAENQKRKKLKQLENKRHIRYLIISIIVMIRKRRRRGGLK